MAESQRETRENLLESAREEFLARGFEKASLRREGYREVRYISGVERLGFVPRYARAPGMLRGVGLLYGRK